jgi:hypothetical protein
MSEGNGPVVDRRVLQVVRRFLEIVDAETPGFVEGLYLTGSIALGDYRSGQSDIDFVAVSSAPANAAQIRALERAHAALTKHVSRPSLDGPYLTWNELAADPTEAASGPYVRDNRFMPSSRSDRHVVAWHSLARHGIAIRGPEPVNLAILADPAALADWTRGNLESYWRRWWESASRLRTPLGIASLGTWAPAWGVLGVSRLHYTLATGEITSKTGAGEYAREAFDPKWRRIVDECLRIRRRGDQRSLYRHPFARRRDALAFMEMAIEDALRI